MAIDLSKFLDTFFEESAEGVDAMESGLLNMQEGAADNELINTIFRAAHSIKGGGATFGLTAVAEFTHNVETLLDEMRSDQRPVTTAAVDVLLESVDVIRAMLAAAREKAPLDTARAAVVTAKLEQQLNGAPPAAEAVSTAAQTNSVSGGVPGTGWTIRFVPKPHLFRTGNDPVRMFREIEALGVMSVECDTGRLPGFSDIDPEQCYLAWTITVRGPVSETSVRELFEWVDGDCDLELSPIPPLAGGQPASAVTADTSAEPADKPVAQDERRLSAVERKTTAEAASIRVNIDKVDALINMVGELVITQSMLSQIGKDFDIARLEKLTQGLAQLERNTRELQESVMRIRMMPISFAFQRFPRMVRDLSQKLNKKIELRMSGEQTELDKTVMEKIGDPLVHLVRNSVDHGIEMPEVRRAAGKAETGVVTLNAFHQGGNVVIEIKDDGAGLPRDKIIARARRQGLLGADEVPDDDKVFELIFMAGFSTAEQVSDVSGRGVGMDVVRKNIKALGGGVDVKSEPGKGSTFTIHLPLTLAIMDGQSVLVGGENYIIPLVSIVESIQLKPGMVNLVSGAGEVLRLRDEVLPILRLYRIFNVASHVTDLHRGLLVVVEGEGKRVGLFVDELLGQQQVVIKSLETNFRKVAGVSGATILGDGTVALILDIPGLVQLAQKPADAGRVVPVDNKAMIAA